MCSKIVKKFVIQNQIYKLFHISSLRFIHRNISLKNSITQDTARSSRKILDRYNNPTQEQLLSTALENSKVPTVDEWTNLKSTVLSEGKYINEVNFDAKALSFCIEHKNYEAAKTLLQFYQQKNENLNIAAQGKLMKLYYTCNEEKNNISQEDENNILQLFENIKEQHPILSSITIEYIIPTLSLTREWKTCLELLENLKITTRPSNKIYSVIIKAAFENNEFDLGWKLIDEMTSLDKFPYPMVYKTWLKKFCKSKDSIERVKYLLNYFSYNDILPSKDVTDSILQILQPFSYSGTYTTLTKQGVCQSCKKKLQEINITNDEFNQLKSVFMDNVIIGKNIFSKTNPEELNTFKSFLSGKSFDVVIDGLNVAYSAGNKKNPQFYAKLLANVVRHYRLNSKSVLILGRDHMHKWPKQFMNYVTSNAEMFLTQNLSQDDPFLLYATMSSGLGTHFLSRDFMRGHLYLLMDPNLKRIFRKWQQLHQHSLIYAEENGQIHIKPPFPILCTTQESKNGWHIPYVEHLLNNPPMTFDPPKNWLCIQRN